MLLSVKGREGQKEDDDAGVTSHVARMMSRIHESSMPLGFQGFTISPLKKIGVPSLNVVDSSILRNESSSIEALTKHWPPGFFDS